MSCCPPLCPTYVVAMPPANQPAAPVAGFNNRICANVMCDWIRSNPGRVMAISLIAAATFVNLYFVINEVSKQGSLPKTDDWQIAKAALATTVPFFVHSLTYRPLNQETSPNIIKASYVAAVTPIAFTGMGVCFKNDSLTDFGSALTIPGLAISLIYRALPSVATRCYDYYQNCQNNQIAPIIASPRSVDQNVQVAPLSPPIDSNSPTREDVGATTFPPAPSEEKNAEFPQ